MDNEGPAVLLVKNVGLLSKTMKLGRQLVIARLRDLMLKCTVVTSTDFGFEMVFAEDRTQIKAYAIVVFRNILRNLYDEKDMCDEQG